MVISTSKSLIEYYLLEDLGSGDLSVLGLDDQLVSCSIVSRDTGVFAGKSVVKDVFDVYNYMFQNSPVDISFNNVSDGSKIDKGQTICRISANRKSILSCERVILNLIGRMSAIATKTSVFNNTLQNSYAKNYSNLDRCPKICDTRKTAPGLRYFDKSAVKIGGGRNHRFGLYDAVMVKDNHISAYGSITNAVQTLRNNISHTTKIEVEVETSSQAFEAIDAKSDIIMFDNWSSSKLEEFIGQNESSLQNIITECSGSINLNNLESYAIRGLDYISVGQLTHSLKVFDMSLLFDDAIKNSQAD